MSETKETIKTGFKIIARKDLPVINIKISSKNPRHHFRGAAMEDLKNSIQNLGLIQPIIVKSIEDNKYETIAGNRRLFAFQELKKKIIPSIIIEANSEITEADIALLENLIRDDLTPIEEAKAYLNRWLLMGNEDTENFQYDKIASIISKELPPSYNHIKNILSLLRLPKGVQDAIHLKKFKRTYGYEISRLNTEEQMLEYYGKIKSNKKNWTVARLKEEIDEILEGEREKTGKIRKIKTMTLENIKKNLREKREVRNKHLEDFINITEEIKKYLKKEDKKEDAPDNIYKILQNYIKVEKETVDYDWKRLQQQINDDQKRVNSIDALLNQVEQLSITVCPYCEAGIDIEALTEKQQKLREQIEDSENKQLNLNSILNQFQKSEQDFKKTKNILEKANQEIKGFIRDIVKYRKEIDELEVK